MRRFFNGWCIAAATAAWLCPLRAETTHVVQDMSRAPVIGGERVQPKAWTLEAALSEALRNSPDARIAQERLAASKAVVELADSAVYPKLSAGAGYMQTDNPMQSFGNILNERSYSPSIDFNDPGQTDAFNTGLYLKYDLYTGGATSARREGARSMDVSSQYDRDAVYSALSEEVARAYFSIVQSREMEASVLKSQEALQESLRVARELEAAGKLLKSERLNVEVQFLNTEEALLAIRHQQEISQRRFAALLGMERFEKIEIAPQDPALAALKAPAGVDPVARPEYSALEKKAEAAGHAVHAAAAGQLPTVSLLGGYEYVRGWRLDGWGDSWTGAVVVQIPLFDGFATRARVREATAKVNEYNQQLRKLELDLRVELEKARLTYELTCKQYDLSERQLEQAQESARLIRERFAVGGTLSTELLNAESRLLAARIKHDLARNSKMLTCLQWRRALGLSLLPNS